MSKTNSQPRTGTIALVILLLIVVAVTWLVRGFYDRLFFLEGQVVVVNATAVDHTIRFAFPAGEVMEVDLEAGNSFRFGVDETGEGSIGVTIDGARREDVGYVTSMNGMVVLTIDEDRVIFSQVSL